MQTADHSDEEYMNEEYLNEEECDDGSSDSSVVSFGSSSAKYDSTEVNAYLDKAIVGKFEALQFQWKNYCSDCSMQLDTYGELLTHIEISHNACDKLSCIIGDCAETFDNVNVSALARHIVIQHYDLNSSNIYFTCPDCDRRFSNLQPFNKHSCARLKRKSGMLTYCNHCKQEFPSFKRYVFHMQYHLPKCRPMLCLLCARRFSNAEHFFWHVQYNHEPATTHACMLCDIVYKNKILYEQHNRQCHAIRWRYKCTHCSKQYNHNSMLVRHVNKCHNEASGSLKCDVCGKHYADKTQLRKHQRQRHVLQADVHVNVCSKCGLIGRDPDDLIDHVESPLSLCFRGHIEEDILSSAYTCLLCSQDFRSVADLRSHRATDVHNDGRYHCPMCDWQCDELKIVRLHMKGHKSYKTRQESFPLTRLYLCDAANCEASYSALDVLYKHKWRLHSPSSVATENTDMQSNCNEFRCKFCEKQYKTKVGLSMHITRTHCNKNVCSKCACAFKEEQSLLQHISKAHTPVKCTECEKVVRNSRYLKMHLRIMHKKEERYFCAKCKKGFFYRSDLETHERGVHSQVTYQCGKCPFKTNYKNTIVVHESKHRNIMEFKCHVCSKEFSWKRVLDEHIKCHDVSSQYQCSDRFKSSCSESFVSIAKLNKHIRQKHPEVADKVAPLRYRSSKRNMSQLQLDLMEDADDSDAGQENVVEKTI